MLLFNLKTLFRPLFNRVNFVILQGMSRLGWCDLTHAFWFFFYHQKPIHDCFVYRPSISFGFCSLQVLSTQFSKSGCLNEPVVPWHNVTLIDIRRIRSYSTVCLVLNGCKRSPHFLSTDDVQSNSNAVENTKNWVQNCKAKLIMDSPG